MANYSAYFQAVLRPSTPNLIEAFFSLDGRYSNFRKETFFARCLCGEGYPALVRRLQAWQGEGKGGRLFLPAFPKLPDQGELKDYLERYDGGTDRLPFSFENPILEEAFRDHYRETLDQFRRSRGRAEESIVRNFGVKLLFWIDRCFPKLFVDTGRIGASPKFVCGGPVKLPEYLFLCLLFRMGCDVLYVSGEQDVQVQDDQLLQLSVLVREQIPAPAPPRQPQVSTARPVPQAPAAPPPERRTASAPSPTERRELDYVELARLASSVVMLEVYDGEQQCFKTGSGVIINQTGYILTNFHVVAGGRYFGVLLEGEQDVCYTDELIKYNQDLDLAILRMEKQRPPIPVWQGGGELVRGQKVVAIGSPLGLFNTVSDGIISGFRTVGERSMIQFTAPTSHGSSGGALLNLYGELIGILTAGFDDGQNLNLAVDAGTILDFARGLL